LSLMNIGDVKIGLVKVGLIGGTGEEGRGLALRFAKAGAQVTIGSRSAERAKEAADELNKILGGELIRYGTNQDAIRGSELVLITVPFDHAVSTLEAHLNDFSEGAILIDITVPVTFEKGARYVELPEGSASEHLRARLPDAIPLVAAFKTEPAHLLLDPAEALDCDVFVASDSKEAKARVMEVIRFIEGARPVDAGTLRSAGTLERMTVLAIGINRRYKIKSARYRVLGLS
jgi:NADPH-dependent F420 reductase